MIQPETTAGRFRFYEKRKRQRLERWWTDENGTIHMPLTRGYEALIDICDQELASQFVWFAVPNTSGRIIYAKACVPQCMKVRWPAKFIGLHQLILNTQLGQEVDHRNRNGLDCRRFNMRLATRAQNGANRVWPKSQSGYRGVKKCHRKWAAIIQSKGNQEYLGLYNSAEEAAMAYNKAAIAQHGEFAVLNEVAI